MKPLRVLLADDQAGFRAEVKRILRIIPVVEIVGEAQDGISLLNGYREYKPNLIVLRLSMLGFRRIDVLRELKQMYKRVKLLVVSSNGDRELLYQTIFAGAEGFILRGNVDTQLPVAVEKIRRRKKYLDSCLENLVAEDFRLKVSSKGPYPWDVLTQREKEVLRYVVEEYPNREIARRLNRSIRTVENHRARILRKLNTNKTSKLVRYAIKTGVIDLYGN